MEVEESSGTLRWTPMVEQADIHRISVKVSDGVSKNSFDTQDFNFINSIDLLIKKNISWRD